MVSADFASFMNQLVLTHNLTNWQTYKATFGDPYNLLSSLFPEAFP